MAPRNLSRSLKICLVFPSRNHPSCREFSPISFGILVSRNLIFSHSLCCTLSPNPFGFLTCFPYRIVCYYPMQIRPLKPCPWLPRRGDFQPINTRPCRTLSYTTLYQIFTTPFTNHPSLCREFARRRRKTTWSRACHSRSLDCGAFLGVFYLCFNV